jgi:LAS superfamily LD-carboxypeptidase LdcB
LKANRREVRAQIAALDSAVRLSEQKYATAAATAATARAAAESAMKAADAADATSRQATEDLKESVTQAFAGSSRNVAAVAVMLSDRDEGSMRTAILHSETLHRARLLADSKAASAAARKAAKGVNETFAAASAAEEAARNDLAAATKAKDEMAGVLAQLDSRLEASLAEAEALAALNAAAAQKLRADEVALHAAAKSVATAPAPAKAASTPAAATPAPATTAATAPAPTTTAPKVSTAPKVTAAPATTTTSPPTTSAPRTSTVSIVTVKGIPVAASIAKKVEAMLNASASAGLKISGSGYRDSQRQIDLRRQNCGDSDYAIYDMPASQCTPPTARPGASMHEQGLALDLTCAGVLIESHSDPCFVWLAAHAKEFGFFNLPSEPWHWSVNGN